MLIYGNFWSLPMHTAAGRCAFSEFWDMSSSDIREYVALLAISPSDNDLVSVFSVMGE